MFGIWRNESRNLRITILIIMQNISFPGTFCWLYAVYYQIGRGILDRRYPRFIVWYVKIDQIRGTSIQAVLLRCIQVDCFNLWLHKFIVVLDQPPWCHSSFDCLTNIIIAFNIIILVLLYVVIEALINVTSLWNQIAWLILNP